MEQPATRGGAVNISMMVMALLICTCAYSLHANPFHAPLLEATPRLGGWILCCIIYIKRAPVDIQ